MNRVTPSDFSRSTVKFFLLVFALSLPFWLAGAWTTLQLLPGLPVSAVMAFCPATAALMLVYRKDKAAGVTALLKRSFDYERITAKVWYADRPADARDHGLVLWSLVFDGSVAAKPRYPVLRRR